MHVETSAVSCPRSVTLPPVGWAGSAWMERRGRERRSPRFHVSYLKHRDVFELKVMLGVSLSHPFVPFVCP